MDSARRGLHWRKLPIAQMDLPAMLTAADIETRFRTLASECSPGGFDSLFSIAQELSELASAIPDVDSPVRLFSSHRDLCNHLIAAINESSAKGLLSQGDNGKLNRKDHLMAEELRQGIVDDNLKTCFLNAMLLSTTASLAVSLLKKGTSRNAAGYIWQDLVHTIRGLPALAPIAAELPLDVLSTLNKEYREATRTFYHQNDLKMINIHGAVNHAEFDAWEALLSLPKLSADEKKRRIQAIASKLRQVLDFLSAAEEQPWKVAEFYEMHEGLTHVQIMGELRRYEPKPIDGNHRLSAIRSDIVWKDVYSFSQGKVFKTDFVFAPLGVDCFASNVTTSILAEWESNPIRYMYQHLGEVGASMHATRIRLELQELDEVLLGIKLQRWMMHTVEKIGPEFLALGIVEWSNLPHICTPFLTQILHRLFRTRRTE